MRARGNFVVYEQQLSQDCPPTLRRRKSTFRLTCRQRELDVAPTSNVSFSKLLPPLCGAAASRLSALQPFSRTCSTAKIA